MLGRQHHHAHVHTFRQNHIRSTQGGMDARRITVVEHGDVLRVTLDEADLLHCQRGAAAGHHILDADLVHAQHVEIAFHEDTFVLAGDGVFGKIDTVKRLLLVVNLRLWRVLVFRAFLVVGEDAAAKADNTPRQAVDGEHHTAMVTVV